MARLPRVVIPGIPHHITHRGNRRERVFFEDSDYELYLDLLTDAARQARCAIWTYCLMPNHVHAIIVPSDTDGLRKTFATVHRHYTGYINARLRVTGHLWQGRYGSVAMDDAHAIGAIRYVSLNPVRARLVARPEDWRWSSVRAYLKGGGDPFVGLRRSSNVPAISRRSWARSSTRRCPMRPCARPKAWDGQWDPKTGWQRWRHGPGSCSRGGNRGRWPLGERDTQ